LARQAGDSVAARRQTAAIIAISGTAGRQLEQILTFADLAKAQLLK
jgi:hypothetical protein